LGRNKRKDYMETLNQARYWLGQSLSNRREAPHARVSPQRPGFVNPDVSGNRDAVPTEVRGWGRARELTREYKISRSLLYQIKD
jgi:hypothetical protein